MVGLDVLIGKTACHRNGNGNFILGLVMLH